MNEFEKVRSLLLHKLIFWSSNASVTPVFLFLLGVVASLQTLQ